MTWGLTIGQLSVQAYRRLGVLPAGGVPTDDQFNQAIIAFNAMALGMQADGINLFRQTQISLNIPAGIGYSGNPYVILPQIANFEQARWVVTPGPNQYERPLGVQSYIDYMNQPNKLSKSSSGPSIYCFDPQSTQSNLYLWPLPTNGGTLNATVARLANTVSLPSDPLDFPPSWVEGLYWCLADRLMDDEGVAAADDATATRISTHAALFYEKLLNYDRPDSIWIRPYGKAGSGKFWRG